MATQVVTCSSCGVGLRLPEVAVASIFKCPKCQARVRVEPKAQEPVDEWIRVEDEPQKGALGNLADWVAKGGTKIKDALNISGVSMKLEGFPDLLPDAAGKLAGRVVLTSGSPKTVHKLTVALAGTREMAGLWKGPDPLRVVPGEPLVKAVELRYKITPSCQLKFPLKATCDVEGALRSVTASHVLRAATDLSVDLELPAATIARSSHCAAGSVVLVAGRERVIEQVSCKLIMLETWNPAIQHIQNKRYTPDTRRKETLVGEWIHREPFRLRPNEKKRLRFEVGFSIGSRMKEMDGVLGTLGTMASYIQNENDEFFLLAECQVQNGLANPQHQRKVVIVP
jgi:hypothetical protein